MKLEALTWQDFKRLVPSKIDTALLPVGTIEAHGVATLATDNLIPETLAQRMADKVKALILPTVPYGITRSLFGYPGSFTISPQNFTAYLVDIFRSIATQKFRRLVVLNGHGGNNDALKQAALDINHTTGLKIAVIHWWTICQKVCREVYGEAGGHAALDETAFVLAVKPEYVKKNQYKKEMAYLMTEGGADIYPNPGSIILYEPGQGYLNFDPEKAQQYVEGCVKEVTRFVLDIFVRWKKI